MQYNLTIREYKQSDRSILLELLQLNIPTYFAASELEDFKEYLENDLEKYFVVEVDDTVIGAGGINFETNAKSAKISWDFIDPNFQGKRIGQKLLKHRIDLINTMDNIQLIEVRTSQFAFEFYAKNGFYLVTIEKDYWAKGFDLYSMVYKEIEKKCT